MHRRMFLAGFAATTASLRARAAPSAEERLNRAGKHLAEIEAREAGRLGVFVRDPGTGATLEHRTDERFPMRSTFKLLAAAAALKRVDEGAERLDRRIAYGPSDLLDYAPIAKARVAEGAMTLADLCAAAIDWSDNTAANLVLQAIGGPAGFTQFAHSLGDTVTRLDRNEPTLNEATPAMSATRRVRAPWLRTCRRSCWAKRSRMRLAASSKRGSSTTRSATNGCAPGCRADGALATKTGTGDQGTANTIAIIWPPERAPIIAAVYYTDSSAPMDARNAIHKEVGGLIAETFS
jgi:beta-lactamase class A